MEPNTALLEGVDSTLGGKNDPNSTYSMVQYYFVCEGYGPLNSHIADSYADANELNYTLHELYYNASYVDGQPACYNNINIAHALNNMTKVYAILDGLYNSISCSPIQHILFKLINNGFCKYTVSGIFTIWIGLFVFSGALFFLNFTAGIMYQYFDNIMWNIGSEPISSLVPVNDDDEPVDQSITKDKNNVSPRKVEMVKQNQVVPL